MNLAQMDAEPTGDAALHPNLDLKAKPAIFKSPGSRSDFPVVAAFQRIYVGPNP